MCPADGPALRLGYGELLDNAAARSPRRRAGENYVSSSTASSLGANPPAGCPRSRVPHERPGQGRRITAIVA